MAKPESCLHEDYESAAAEGHREKETLLLSRCDAICRAIYETDRYGRGGEG